MNAAAETIRQQIGNRAFVMMGASNIGFDGPSLMWKLGKNPGKFTHITVALTEMDTYTVTFHTIAKNYSSWKKDEVSGLHAEDLHRVIQDKTKLYLSL